MNIEFFVKKWYNRFPETIDPYEIQQNIIGDHIRDFEEGDIADRLFKFKVYKKQIVALNKIRGGQWNINEQKVARFKNRILNGEIPFPVVYNKRRASIIDGSHRYEAFKELGFKQIVCYIGI